MPIYEYECEKCGSINEFLEGITKEKTSKKCKSCNSNALHRKLSACSISTKSSECRSCPGDEKCSTSSTSCCSGGKCSH